MDIYIQGWHKLKKLRLISAFMWIGWVPCAIVIFNILRLIFPDETMRYYMFIVLILWWGLSLFANWKLSAFRCPRCQHRFFKGGLLSTLRSNCSYCGLNVNETQGTEKEIQENPEPKFDTSSGQFIPYRIFGSIFLIGGAWITIKGLLSLIIPESTITINGVESINFNDKMMLTLFGFIILLFGCIFAILPVKIAIGLAKVLYRTKSKIFKKT